jgi:hypothetical protein
MGATAFLVAWRDGGGHGRIVDVGIYSEEMPTIPIHSDRRTQCLMSVESHQSPGEGGYGRAQARMRAIVAGSPWLHWVQAMPTYRRMMQWDRRHVGTVVA